MTEHTTARKGLPGAWLHALAHLLEHGQARTDEIAQADGIYAVGTLRSALSNMHQAGLVQRLPGMLWGLSKAGIDAALQAEEEAALVQAHVSASRSY